MKTIIISAIGQNNCIGVDNKIPWHIKEDFQRFKRLTLNHTVVMGRKTFESLPIKPLPKRRNIVLSRNPDLKYLEYPDVIVCDSMDSAKKYALEQGETELFVIGGARVYALGMDFADVLEITHVDQSPQGDTFFPEIDLNTWKVVNSEPFEGYSFVTYERK
jgi:dihydrofolate reductase